MKKIIFPLLTMISLLLFVSSCSKDDPASTSTFTLNRDALVGNIADGTVILESGTYKLTGPLYVKSGATLKINPGVIIESQGNGAEGFIAIEQGGKIDAQGTSASPIVFTSSVKSPGSWGGIVICGKAPTNKGATASAEVTGLTYGGTESADNSGTMRYCIVEYSGNKISGTKEFNGMNFFGVGSGTTIEYIQVKDGSDDAYEWFGGTVNCKYLYANNIEDDLYDWTEGWSGGVEYAYGTFGTSNASDDSRGFEGDNLEANFAASPIANPTFKNVSLIGRASAPAAGEQKEGMKIRRGTKGIFENIYVSGFSTGVNIESDESLANNTTGTLKLTNIQVVGATAGKEFTGKKTDGTSATIVYTAGTTTGAGSSAAKPSWASFTK